MKIYFTGSDVQLLNEFPPQLSLLKLPYVLEYRSKIRKIIRFAEEIWVCHEHLIPELNRFGIIGEIKVVPAFLNHTVKYPKVKHEGFNIFYYCPGGEDAEWRKWIYGYDVFQRVKDAFRFDEDIHFIVSSHPDQYDMREIFPITDFCLRCNNHDADARTINECKIQEIPYYWSYEKPDYETIINKIKEVYEGM